MNRTHFIPKDSIIEIILDNEKNINEECEFYDDTVSYGNETIANINGKSEIVFKDPRFYFLNTEGEIFLKPILKVDTKNGMWEFKLNYITSNLEENINTIISEYLWSERKFLNTYILINSINQLID